MLHYVVLYDGIPSSHICELYVLKILSLVEYALFENNILVGKMKFVSHFLRYHCESNTCGIIIRLQCLDLLYVNRMHVMFSKNPLNAGAGKPDCEC